MLRNALVSAIAVAFLVGHPLQAAACSAGPDFDPRDHTQLLVLGRARSIELGPGTAFGMEATVTLDVVHVFRGTAASPLRFVDSRSALAVLDLRTGREHIEFAGSAGGCGTIDDDPVDKYVLIALAGGEDARWHANRLYGAIYTDQPEYAMYRWLLERHGVAVPFLISGTATDVSVFGPALAP